MTEHDFRRAVELLQAGELVAFPTETVYGLGGDATSDAAVARIYAAKERRSIAEILRELIDKNIPAQN